MHSRRSLARRLEDVEDFTDPSVELEQYLTPPELAANVLHVAALQGDLSGRTVLDLGTGTGMFAVGASFADPSPLRVVGLDRDAAALETARENARRVGDGPIDWIRADATRPPLACSDATVLSNPPFGAQRGRRHADRAFLESARDLGRVSYTVHNRGSQGFVESFAADEGGAVTHAFRAAFPVDRRFAFHDDEERELAVEVFRIEWK